MRFDPSVKHWKSVNPLKLLTTLPVYLKTKTDQSNIEKNIKKITRDITDIFLWLDCDREGEAIAYEVLEISWSVKRNFEIHRAIFSSVSPAELRSAFDNP